MQAAGPAFGLDGDRVLDGLCTRALTSKEVSALRAQGNISTDPSWANVRVILDGTRWVSERVQRCRFSGTVALGSFLGRVPDRSLTTESGHPAVMLPSGIYDSTLTDSVVHSGAFVERCGVISNTVIRRGAVVRGCQTISCPGPSPHGNGTQITIGPETGGREITITAESDLETLAAACLRTSTGCSAAESWKIAAARYTAHVTRSYTVISERAVAVGCPEIVASFLGPGVHVAASTITDATLMGEPGKPSSVSGGSIVRSSIIQPGAAVADGAMIERTLLCEHATVNRHAIVTSVVLGPHSSVSEGEVSSSLVGPFVGFHHQALLVAAFWPAGRGNIGYGANVGSNHTGKRNDQEIWPGEGVFYGLGCSIKYPCNFAEAQYSLVATGVTTLPQRLQMPFSLVNTAGERIAGVSPLFNEITPAWVLSDNMYQIYRNRAKYRDRQARAQRMMQPVSSAVDEVASAVPQFTHEIMRPDTVAPMIRARRALMKVAGKATCQSDSGEPVYLDHDLPGGLGIGKNYMRERSRTAAVAAYTNAIDMFILRVLFDAIRSGCLSRRDVEELLQPSAAVSYERSALASIPTARLSQHKRSRGGTLGQPLPTMSYRLTGDTLQSESLTKQYSKSNDYVQFVAELLVSNNNAFIAGICSVADVVTRLGELLQSQAASIVKSKAKDYTRGQRIIPDYSAVHCELESDPIVIAARVELANFRRDALSMTSKL